MRRCRTDEAYLEGLSALHDGEQTYRRLANCSVADRVEYPRAEHPVVRTRSDGQEGALAAASPASSSASPRRATMLAYRYQHAENPLFQCLRWTKTPSPSGTTAAPSTAQCGITGRTRGQAHA
jgi:taurine dioxygenase